MTVHHVAEWGATAPETIDHCARILRRSPLKQVVFIEVYRGSRKAPKTAEEIGKRTKPTLSVVRVLQIAGSLANQRLFERVKEKGKPIGYKKYPHINEVKAKILRLARDPRKLAKHVTTRRPAPVGGTVVMRIKRGRAERGLFVDARPITIDGIDNFRKVRGYSANKLPKKLPAPLPETKFKNGIAKILGNRDSFKDWGGEWNDLYSTQMHIERKRYPVAIALKGPAKKPPLTLAKMGKNGDQIPRLFKSAARIFLVQFEGRVAEAVHDLLETLAMRKSQELRQTVWFGVIAKEDSARLRLKYPKAFK